MADYKITIVDSEDQVQVLYSLEKTWGHNPERYINSIIRVALDDMFLKSTTIKSVSVEKIENS